MVANILVLVGASKLSIVGAMEMNVIETALSGMPAVVRVLYVLIGLAGVMMVIGMAKGKCCKRGSCSAPSSGAPSGGAPSGM